jgi:large subunit ribosomal protein L25
MNTPEILKVQKKQALSGRANQRLRKSGYLTGSICSKEIGSISILFQRDLFSRIISNSGKSTVFQLIVDDDTNYYAMVKEISVAPIGGYLDVSFQQMSLSEETKAEVSIKLDGKESLRLKRMDVMQHISTITIKGLPGNIPNSINIDLSNMEAGDSIFIGDIKFPQGIHTDTDPKQMVVSITEQYAENPNTEEV